jgi:hypothetical protein
MSIYSCIICNSNFPNIRKLSKHIRDKHKIGSKQYYDQHIKSEEEGACIYCNQVASFINLNNGYKTNCRTASCISKKRSDSATNFRSSLKCDPVRFDKFKAKVATNQSDIWAHRKVTGEDVVIFEKASRANKINMENMSPEERREKYGWLNKLEEDDKQKWIESSLKTGMHRWWQNAPAEEIIERVFSVAKRYLQGQFKPRNPHKYKGDVTRILYRSSLELRCMTHFDNHQDVIWWQSEEVIVPYRDAGTGRNRRYFPDFVININNKEGINETLMIEVKPQAETEPPKKTKNKKEKTFIKEAMTWGTNSSKWAYAEKFCTDRKWKFVILTEKEILSLDRNRK